MEKIIWLIIGFIFIIGIGALIIIEKTGEKKMNQILNNENEIKGLILPAGEEIGSRLIGQMPSIKEIKVISKDYIDKYIDWGFEEINDSIWKAKFFINEELINKIKECQVLSGGQRNSCFIILCNDFFSNEIDCNTASRNELVNNLLNMSDYPLRNISGDMKFNNFNVDMETGTGKSVV